MKKFILNLKNHLLFFRTKKVLFLIGSLLIVLLLLLWLAGTFSAKIDYNNPKTTEKQSYTGKTAKVSLITVPLTETASGTVQAIRETTITSKLTARVMGVYAKAGETVKKGQLIIKLDDTELQGKLQQGKADIALSESNLKQAQSDYVRYSSLFKSRAVSKQDFENVETKEKNSRAQLNKAKGIVSETEALIRYANIVSPIDGLVVDKEVDVGDTVLPGQVLLKLYDNTAMQLIANVRESLANRLTPGQDIEVKIDALDKICSAKVREIVPESNSTDRTFQVKAGCLEEPVLVRKGIYSGNNVEVEKFAIPKNIHIRINALGQKDVLVIPENAVIKRNKHWSQGRNFRDFALGRFLQDL